MSEISLLPMEKQVDSRLDTGVNKTLEDLEGDTQQRDWSIALCIPWGLVCQRITISALLQILGSCGCISRKRGIHTIWTSFQCQHGVLTLGGWNLCQGLSQASGVGGQP